MHASSRISGFGGLTVAIALAAAGCVGEGKHAARGGSQSDAGDGPSNVSGFVSDDPSLATAVDNPGAGGAAGIDDPNAPPRDATPGDDIGVVQTSGTRLYALSASAGLTIVDTSAGDAKVLGRFETQGAPAGLFLRDGVAFVLLSSTSGGKSRVVALDTTDPAHVAEKGEFEIAGIVRDGRLVGDVLSVVAHEDGYCGGCTSGAPRVTVVSLNVAAPSAMAQVDTLPFPDVHDGAGWHSSRTTFAGTRIYVSGRNSDTKGTTVRIVDTTDPAGDLRLGTTLELSGGAPHLDERDGVLRAVSGTDSGAFRSSVEHSSVQTFTVVNSDTVTGLGSATLSVPSWHTLRAVRFDEGRAYASTNSQGDPLYVLDLSTPAAPVESATVPLPGNGYILEPRGDRLIVGGTDASGANTLWLYGVADPRAPSLLDTASIGPVSHSGAGLLPLAIDEGLHLIVAPFSSGARAADCAWLDSAEVQLVDWIGDDLSPRGIAPAGAENVRGSVQGGRLVAVTGDAVTEFDLTNRDAPTRTGSAARRRTVTGVAVAGDSLVRIAQDTSSSGFTTIDAVPLADPGVPAIASRVVRYGDETCPSSFPRSVVAAGSSAFVFGDGAQGDLQVASFDLSTPSDPQPLGTRSIPGTSAWYDPLGVIEAGSAVVRAGSALVRRRVTIANASEEAGTAAVRRASLDVVDLRDPVGLPVTSLDMPPWTTVTGLLADDTNVLVGRGESLDDGTGRLRFFLDRYDTSDPGHPALVSSANIPGSLFAWDAADHRALTVDYRHVVLDDVTRDRCLSDFQRRAVFTPTGSNAVTGRCVGLEYTLRLVDVQSSPATVVASYDLPRGRAPEDVAVGDGSLFVGTSLKLLWGPNCYDCYPTIEEKAQVLVLSGLSTGTMQVTVLPTPQSSWGGRVLSGAAAGSRALVDLGDGALSVIDASLDPPAVVRTIVGDFSGQVTMNGSRAIFALGPYGVSVVDLAE